MNEAETRAELIDPLLVAAGWGVVERSRIRREFPIAPGRIEGGGRRGKSLSADYVLSYRNTALAVVEANFGGSQQSSVPLPSSRGFMRPCIQSAAEISWLRHDQGPPELLHDVK